MLSKLMKYEFKATGRTMWPVCGAFLLIAIVNSIFFALQTNNGLANNSFVETILSVSVFIYILAMLALVVVTYIVVVMRFYKNDLSTEGYLTHTLPVTTNEELISKTIIGTFWMIMSAIVVVFSILIITIPIISAAGDLGEMMRALSKAWQEATAVYGGNVFAVLLEFIVLFIISSVNGVLAVYASLALGHTFKKNKVLASFGMYILINTVVTFLSTILVSFIGAALGSTLTAMTTMSIVHLSLIGTIVLTAVYTGIFYLITYNIIDTKLNLE